MKPYKRHSAATKAAAGMPIVRVGFGSEAVYLVPGHRDLVKLKLTEVSLVAPTGLLAGHITLGHLDRLGNANHAAPGLHWTIETTCFAKEDI